MNRNAFTARYGLLGVAAVVWLVAGCATGSSSPAASATARPSVPAASRAPTLTPDPTMPLLVPIPTSVDGVAATVMRLGVDAAPIDLVYAFGSIWVANHHSDDVSRIDPESFKEIARIKSGPGPGWFAVTDDAIWVTNQNAAGVTRIDPKTNQAVATIGDLQPCWWPVAAAKSVWQWACDDRRYVRIDATTNATTLADTKGHDGLFAIDGKLFVGGPGGLAELDPETGAFRLIGGCCGRPIGFDGRTVWLADENKLARVDRETGMVLATFDLDNANTMIIRDGHVWVTRAYRGVSEIELDSNKVLRTLALLPVPIRIAEVAGALWVTEYERSELWRLEP
jgi:YVTN family beta-propeller protein